MSQIYKTKLSGLDQFFWCSKPTDTWRYVTTEELEQKLIREILRLRHNGYQIDDMHYVDLFSNFVRCDWIGSNDGIIEIFLLDVCDRYIPNPKDIYPLKELIKTIQGDFSYPRPLQETTFRYITTTPENYLCPICKKDQVDNGEVFLMWKGREQRNCSAVCIDCWDRIQGLFYEGWQDTEIKIKQQTTELQIKRKKEPVSAPLRHEVLKRDNYRCRECGKTNKQTSLEIDHIIPVSQGGSNELINLQTLCVECNRAKHNRMWVGGE